MYTSLGSVTKENVFWDGSFRLKSPVNACKCSSTPQTLCFCFLDEVQFIKQSTTWSPSPSESQQRLPVYCQTKQKHTSHFRFRSLSFSLSLSLSLCVSLSFLSLLLSISDVELNCYILGITSFLSAFLSAKFSFNPSGCDPIIILLVAVFACSLISATVWPLIEHAAKVMK